MKKLVSVGVLFLVTVTLVSAIGISVGGKGGFGFGTGRMTDGLEVVVNSAGDPTTASPLFYSAAQGIPILVGAEIVPLENLTVELTGGYLFGLEQDVWNYDIQATNVTDVMTAKTSFIPVALTVKGKVPVGQRLTFYGGGGPSFGFGAKSLAVRDYDDGAGTKEHWEYEATYRIGLGYHGVVGINYALTNNLALLAEVRGEQLSFKIKKETLTAYTVNGSDELMTAYPDVAEREIEYVDDISSFVFDPDKPDQDTTYNVFANSITAFIGVMWRIF